MKRLDASEESILDINWAPDGEWIAYTAGKEVRLAHSGTQSIRVIGEGTTPCATTDKRVLFERDGEIHLATGGGIKKIVTVSDGGKNHPKRSPVASPDGTTMVFCVCNVFDKESQSLNSYSHRHFLATATTDGGRVRLLREQWYGGEITWFADGKRFMHYEFDSTAGPQIHIVSASGKREGRVAGLYPSLSPDGSHIAARPRGGGSVVIYSSKGSWSDDDITTSVVRIQAGKLSRASATPPIWLDNRLILVLDGETVFRVDTKKEKSEELKKFILPTERRIPTMVASPDREQIAMEVAVEGGFELRVGKPY